MTLSITSVLVFTIGIFLFIASIILSGTVNRVFRSRSVCIIVGIIGLLIFFIGKYMFYIMDYVNDVAAPSMPGATMDPNAWKSILKARLYLIYLPDLLLLLMSVALLVDKTKNFAKILAPYGLFFGFLYLVCSSFSNTQFGYVDSLINKGAWYEYVFESDGILRMAPIGFIFLILISLWTLIACREYSRWAILASVLIGIPLLLYPFEMQLLKEFDVGANCMTPAAFVGLSAPKGNVDDWMNHKYFPNYFAIFGSMTLEKPTPAVDADTLTGLQWSTSGHVNATGSALIAVIPYVGTFAILTLSILLKNIFTKDIRRVNYIYKPWYYNSRLFSGVCSSIDAKINDWLVSRFNSPYLYGFLEKDMKKINSYAAYLKRQRAPANVIPSKVSEMAEKLEAKQSSKNAKKKAKANKDRINKIEKTLAREKAAQPNATSILQPASNETKALMQEQQVQAKPQQQAQVAAMAQEWTDQNGVYWGMDQSGNYFYKQNDQWVAYVAA